MIEEPAHLDRIADQYGRLIPESLIVFQVGGLLLGLDVRHVSEVARAVPIAVPLPDGGGVVGMITLRGQAAAVVDLGRVLGVGQDGDHGRGRMIAVRHRERAVCLLVDQIDGLVAVSPDDLQAPPEVMANVDIAWLDYVSRRASGELIGILDVHRVLSQTSLAATKESIGRG